MAKKTNITIGVLMLATGIGYFSIRSVRRNRLYAKILSKIGGGAGGNYDYNQYYDSNYWKKDFGVPVILLSDSAATKKARTIESSLGNINDDEGAMYGVLRSLRDGPALSKVSHKYQGLINRDLKEDLEWYFDDTNEVKERNSILSKLAPFTATS